MNWQLIRFIVTIIFAIVAGLYIGKTSFVDGIHIERPLSMLAFWVMTLFLILNK